MSRNKILDTLLLLPISKVFGLVVAVRNHLFDRGIFLKSTKFDVPIISVGNIAVGGTGKTPHVEYILEALRDSYHMAVLSRGYKRKTKGFVMANSRTVPEDIGDESYQLFAKYGAEADVAVCEKRVEGINRLMEINKNIDLFVLDDAFQHRYVKPSVSIVLTEYNHPAFADKMLPLGHLREPMSSLHRADILIVTKCPRNMQPMDYRLFKERFGLLPWQHLFFSRYVYGHLVPVFPEAVQQVPFLDWLTKNDSILVVTGVAHPRPFLRYLRTFKADVKVMCFPDHHSFTANDLAMIKKKFAKMAGEHKILITTEKDSVRLSHNPYFPHALKSRSFYIPISVEFVDHTDKPGFEHTLRKLLNQSKSTTALLR